MIEWHSSWIFYFWPTPLLVLAFVPRYRRRASAIRVSFFDVLQKLSDQEPREKALVAKRGWLSNVLLWLIWSSLIVALARPQYVGELIVHEKSARDLMVAVDLSNSMEARDFVDLNGEPIDRLSAVKSVLTDFVEQRPHDRLGLIVFGDAPFLQVPFTQDHETWLTLLNETEVSMAGSSTALGDAVGLAIKNFQNTESENRVLIVLTDGNDTGSQVPPVEAAKVADRYGMTIYPISIGDPNTVGEQAIDSKTLQRVAQITGGEFYTALDRVELSNIYQKINALEPELFDTLSYRPRHDLFQYPLLASVGLILLLLILASTSMQAIRRDVN